MATTELNVRARGEILHLVRHYGVNGVSLGGLDRIFQRAGKFRVIDRLEENVEYLCGKGYLSKELVKEQLSGVERWLVRITPQGIDLLDETIPADPGVEIVC